MYKVKSIYKVGVFILALMIVGLIAQKNVSAQFLIPPPAPSLFFTNPFGVLPFLPTRSLSVVTGGGGAAVDGIWNGIWLSFVKFDGGPINLTLITDPVTGLIKGTAVLVYNKLIPIPIGVSGDFLPLSTTTFKLTGSYLDILTGELYTLTMTCNILAIGVMDGTFSIVSLKSIDYGSFYATL